MAGVKQERESVGIAPPVQILSILSRLNYRPWFAIAEFVDNSIQSFLDTQKSIRKIDGKDAVLKIKISYNSNDNILSVEDNAGGIAYKDFPRAFRAAVAPPDTSGLHEFGVGMKSAACWFSPLWKVETKHFDDPVSRTVVFDMKKITGDSLDELDIEKKKSPKDAHFTYIEMRDLHRQLNTKTIDKIRRHLASIYREFLRDGTIEINFNGKIEFDDPKVLKAPRWDDTKGQSILWKVEIAEKVSTKKRLTGFIGIREKGSTTEAGLSLFRKRRLIRGSHDEAWKPEKIFGAPNSFMSQRIFGEIHLEGFEVSHTKDGFLIEDDEDQIVELLYNRITKKSLNLIEQSREYRAQANPADLKPKAERALQKIQKKLNRSALKKTITRQTQTPPPAKPPPSGPRDPDSTRTKYRLDFRNEPWELEVELNYSKNARDLFQIVDDSRVRNKPREIRIAIFAYHPFFTEHVGTDQNGIEALFKLCMAICIAEVTARDAGLTKAMLVRANFNEILGKGWSNA